MKFYADLHIHSPYSRATSSSSRLDTSARVGADQGHPGDRHRRLPASGAVCRMQENAPRRRERPLFAEKGVRAATDELSTPACSGTVRLHADRGDFEHLQKRRPRPESAQCRLFPVICGSGKNDYPAGTHRQPEIRRQADPRARLPQPARNRSRSRPGRHPDPGAYLDALVLGARVEKRLRFDRRMLRRLDKIYLCRRDRPLFRPAHELAAFDASIRSRSSPFPTPTRPSKLGRECTVFDTDLSYDGIFRSLAG